MSLTKGDTIHVLDRGFVRYIDHMGDDRRIVEAARVSYKSPSKGDEGDKKLLHYLWKNRHTSPFEMVTVTFNIKMPIFVMRQYIRHRMQSVNEVSARYTELPDEFFVPDFWRKQDTKNKQGSVDADLEHEHLSDLLELGYEKAYKTYKDLLAYGVAKEMARLILPVGIYTEIYAAWDLKNLLHFITLREDPHAQWEHQQYGKAIKKFLVELFPWTMEAYEKYKFEVKESVV